MASDTPAAEIDVTEELVRSLVDSQFGEYADLDLTLVGNGWDNSMYRLGPDLAVRLPRRSLAAPLVLNEQRWLPELAKRLSLNIATPIAFGKPSAEYPWHWSITPWFDGVPAAKTTLDSKQHVVLAQFLTQLHKAAPADAPANTHRGTPLSSRYSQTLRYLEGLTDDITATEGLSWTVDDLKRKWDLAVSVADYDGAPVWLHGDLHPLNIIASDGKIRAIIDFGDITSGDPATDISSAWMLFDRPQLVEFRQLIGCDDNTWLRSQGWAISLGLTYLAHSADSPAMASMGHRALATALDWPA